MYWGELKFVSESDVEDRDTVAEFSHIRRGFRRSSIRPPAKTELIRRRCCRRRRYC